MNTESNDSAITPQEAQQVIIFFYYLKKIQNINL